MIVVRPESAEDFDAVRMVNLAAFGQPQEADLVDALRAALSAGEEPWVSLVAEEDGAVVGHIFFSPMSVAGALGLGPMAVAPTHQRRGIGSRLVRHGLAACDALGRSLVFVLGHPQFYPRFGFVPARPLGWHSEYDVPHDVFMVRGSSGGGRGLVRYHPAFASLG
jgi:putative acetyltransferase